ncbi:MAG: hypothetical protein QXE05_02070 [Nitrososphaeria archaeon]
MLDNVETIVVDGVEAKALTLDAEVVATVTHAIYKEHMYLLTDYYVVKCWLNDKAVALARKVNVDDAIKVCLELNRLIDEGYVEAPIKFNFNQTVKILAKRFVKDSNFRATTLNTIKLATKKRTMQQLVSRIKRKSY